MKCSKCLRRKGFGLTCPECKFEFCVGCIQLEFHECIGLAQKIQKELEILKIKNQRVIAQKI